MVKAFTFSPFQENTYIVIDDETQKAAVIDPGCYDQAEKETLSAFIDSRQLTVTHLLQTHSHLDHVFGSAYVKRKYGVKMYLHELDMVIFNDVPKRMEMYGLRGYDPTEVDVYLREGDKIAVGNTTLDVLHTPGHAPGHVVFVNHKDRYVIGGDVLFKGSIGRTDFTYCDHQALLNSIRTKLYTLPDDYTVYAGHMDPTTIGREKKSNPFIRMD
nr:MBL fold metallo-hydrolase [uncultured Arsenicibacter sp.]